MHQHPSDIQVMVFAAIFAVPIGCFVLIQGWIDFGPTLRRWLEGAARRLPRE